MHLLKDQCTNTQTVDTATNTNINTQWQTYTHNTVFEYISILTAVLSKLYVFTPQAPPSLSRKQNLLVNVAVDVQRSVFVLHSTSHLAPPMANWIFKRFPFDHSLRPN